MQLRCPACDFAIQAEDVYLPRALAKCGACQEVFSFADRLPAASGGLLPRSRVVKPEPFRIARTGKSLRIAIPWYNWGLVPLSLFCLFWDGFMVLWYWLAISQGQWGMALFGSLHALIGLGLTYAAVAGFFNSTTIEVDRGKLRLSHGPVPMPGSKEVEANRIDQIFTRRHTRGRDDDGQDHYELCAVLAGNVQEKLLEHLSVPEHALYLEQELEDFLGLPDRPVSGEVERSGVLLPAGEAPLSLGPIAAETAPPCAVCREPLAGDSVACSRCDRLQHRDCWEYSGVCGTYGCGGKARDP